VRVRVEGHGEVSVLHLEAQQPRALYVLAHGAGAGMRHPFMEAIAQRLAGVGIATLRYQFPYMEKGGHRTDPEPVATATVRAAVAAARELAADLPLLAGGKSFGGRMTSRAAADQPLEGVTGLVFLGFPLHPTGKPGVSRADHLAKVGVPMLFFQGTRDTLADLALLRPVIAKLQPRATLHVIEGGDHSFTVPKKSERTSEQVLDEMARTTADWWEAKT